MRKLAYIQALRGLAALSVVFFHAFESRGGSVVGQAGVDVFFVISGLIMWLTIQREPTPLNFMAHRLARIVPIYWLVTLIMSIHQNPTLIKLLESLLFIPNFDYSGHIWPVLIQGWTLNYEMFFYLLISATLFAPRRLQLGIVVIALVGLVAMHGLAGHNPLALTYTDPMMLEFAAGFGLGAVWSANRTPLLGAPLAIMGALLLVVGLPFTHTIAQTRILLWGVPAVMIVVGALGMETHRFQPPRWLLRLGDISFSIYLLQGLILRPIERVLSHLAQPLPGLLASVAVVGAALVFWRWVEAPLDRMSRRALGRWLMPARGLPPVVA